jgi:hypothetical protein
VPHSTQGTARYNFDFGYRIITFYDSAFQGIHLSKLSPYCSPTTLYEFLHKVWPFPRSLATTEGISFDFFSSRYLDVSVPWVCFRHLFIQCKILVLTSGFPHSDIHGSMLAYQLPVASRRLLRLSSPLTAKASVVCS